METISAKEMKIIAWAVLALFVIGGLFFSPYIAWSVLVGGMLACFNFWSIISGLTKMAQGFTAQHDSLEQQSSLIRQKRQGYILRFIVRILIVGIVLLVLIHWKMVNIFGLIAGLSTIVATVMAIALFMLYRCTTQQV